MQGYSRQRSTFIQAGLGVLLLCVSLLSLSSGVIDTGLMEVVRLLPAAVSAMFTHSPETDQGGRMVLILAEIRIPRLLLGLLAGAGLAICGTVMQGLFRNPMADPGLLGVSSGAALGAVLIIVLGAGLFTHIEALVGSWLLPAAAFAGSLVSILVVHKLAMVNGRIDTATMLLAGIAVNAITGALIGLLSYIADNAQLRDLVFWSLGSLEITDRHKLAVALIVVVPGILLLPRYGNALNANLLGESEAGHLGIDMERTKLQLIFLVALVVGVLVSLSGIIGFVGLVVPHLLRIAIGPDHRVLLPASALFGASLLVTADTIARTVVAPAEIPIGIITAILGGPFFLWLLVRFQHGARIR